MPIDTTHEHDAVLAFKLALRIETSRHKTALLSAAVRCCRTQGRRMSSIEARVRREQKKLTEEIARLVTDTPH